MTEHRHILVIDDDEDFGRVLAIYLRRQGYRVSVAVDGLQGQRIARLDRPDVITLDYKMPAGNGVLICERLKMSAATAHIPVVVITATPTPEVVAGAERAGAIAVLSKVELSEASLAAALDDALARAHEQAAEEVRSLFAVASPPVDRGTARGG